MSTTVFTSNDLPTHLDDRGRFNLWRDMYMAAYCEFDLTRVEDQPFSAQTEYTRFGEVGLARTIARVDRVTRQPSQIAAFPRDHFCLALNIGQTPLVHIQCGRETTHFAGSGAMVNEGEPGSVIQPDGFKFLLIDIPRRVLLDRVANADDQIAVSLGVTPAMDHLRRYLAILPQSFEGHGSGALAGHVEHTLLDLVSLVLAAKGDSAELARSRGLRAARRNEIVAAIREGFADPAISSERVGARVGLSARYVNELLQETGVGFVERVMELRLQKARDMLADRTRDALRVIDIAFDCGFSDVSYFNRSFRRRFSATPLDMRFGRRPGRGL